MPNGGSTAGDVKLGNEIAEYFQKHAADYGIYYMIWRQRIWKASDPVGQWTGMSDRGSPTANHMDHVHISVTDGTSGSGFDLGVLRSRTRRPVRRSNDETRRRRWDRSGRTQGGRSRDRPGPRRQGPVPGDGVDLTTGAGLADALTGADVVIDVSNSASISESGSRSFFDAATPRLLQAEQNAGVQHHVVLSIVGIDRAPYGYYAGKLTQEKHAGWSGAFHAPARDAVPRVRCSDLRFDGMGPAACCVPDAHAACRRCRGRRRAGRSRRSRPGRTGHGSCRSAGGAAERNGAGVRPNRGHRGVWFRSRCPASWAEPSATARCCPEPAPRWDPRRSVSGCANS